MVTNTLYGFVFWGDKGIIADRLQAVESCLDASCAM
jgi:hypothetical protein